MPVQVAGSAAPVRHARHFASPLHAAVSAQQVPSMQAPHALSVKRPEQSGGPPVPVEALLEALLEELPPPTPLLLEALAELVLEALLLAALLLAALLLAAEVVPMVGTKQAPIDGAVTGASQAAWLSGLPPELVLEVFDPVVFDPVVFEPVVLEPVVFEPVVTVAPPAPVAPPALVVEDDVVSLPQARGTRGAIATATRIQE
jgi:hypothetical protein